MCVQARLPDTHQATPIAIGRVTVLRHNKCLDVERLAAQALEQYCDNLKGHIPMSESGMESRHSNSNSSTATRSHHSGDGELSHQLSRFEKSSTDWWAESSSNWTEYLQRNLQYDTAAKPGTQESRGREGESDNFNFLRTAKQNLLKMDLNGASIASYRVGPLSWSQGELSRQQKMKSLHAMVGDRRGGGLGWIAGGKPTEIHITLKGERIRLHRSQSISSPLSLLRSFCGASRPAGF